MNTKQFEKQSNLSKQSESRLDKELAFLFGAEVVTDSHKLSLEDMAIEAELVAEGVRQLIEHKEQPEAQRMIIECMDELTAMALCKWIREPQTMSQIVRLVEYT